MSVNLLWIILGVIGAGCILLILNHDSGTVFGMENDQFASVIWFGVWGVVLASAIIPRPGQWRNFARNCVLWLAIFLVTMAGYMYRYELQDVVSRLTGGLMPGSPIAEISADGREQALLIRSRGGHFEAVGSVDGAPIRFLVDTGASVIVLSNRDAADAGIAVDNLIYSAPVMTANGRTTAARVTLDELSIGEIRRDGLPAMVARPGALEQSLLGMSFLSTLTSFEFRGDRLLLTD
ncbi:MAG: TIGR02281 family clan AA aspartic protease [Rhizobiaceae bacterium]